MRSNISRATSRREGTIKNIATNYNATCKKMKVLVATKKAPEGALPPPEVVTARLFKLDVDDDVWQDIALFDNDLDDQNVPILPPWLSSDRVREAIRVRLELDRCEEEKQRLGWERCALQEWYAKEWDIACLAETEGIP